MTDWPALLRDHGPLVWRTAYRLLGREADAADCYQQTFLAAVELERHEPIRHWPATLKRIAAARALDRLRERYRQSTRSGDLPADQADVRMADPVDLAQAGELAVRLRIALTEIDPRQAEAFCLIALDGHSYDDAAVAMTVSANHAGVLLTRAKTALRERLHAFAPATSGGRQ
jgi:RNA polymerase sigma factor (sigma-70 family)